MSLTWRLRALGPGPAWAVLALGLAALLALGLQPAWQAQALQLQRAQQAQVAQQRAQQRAAAAAGPAWPLPRQAGARLAQLLALAQQHGVLVQSTQQRLHPGRASEPEHLALAMPAVARYAQLRGFVQAALQADPALALAGLRLRRASAQDSALQAELAWAMFQQAGPIRPTGAQP